MIKVVNMKNYRFGKSEKWNYSFKGFGIINTETNEFYSLDGNKPYVLSTKKIMQGCIDGGWIGTTLNPIKLQIV